MVIVLLIAFVLLQAADIWTTWRLLSAGGRELNPIMAKLIAAYGPLPGMLLFKGAVFCALVAVVILHEYVAVAWAGQWAGRAAWISEHILLCASVGLCLVVVVHNWRQMQR